MRELHGVIDIANARSLKRQALLFDEFHIVRRYGVLRYAESPEVEADLSYLLDQGVVTWVPEDRYIDARLTLAEDTYMIKTDTGLSEEELEREDFRKDYFTFKIASWLRSGIAADVVPIHTASPPWLRYQSHYDTNVTPSILEVAVKALPVPDQQSSWEDILAFRADSRDKQWAFRRFLHTMAGTSKTEGELRDEIEWMVNEYRKAMEIHRIKASQSVVEVFLITPLEIIEDLVKLNWSKIAKGILQVRQRKIDLLEAELKAPGRECAYVFDARQRFLSEE